MCAKQWDLGYEELLALFHLPSLLQKRLYIYTLCIKLYRDGATLLQGCLYPDFQHYKVILNPTMQPFAHTNAFFHSFVPSSCLKMTCLNSLPTSVIVHAFNTTTPLSIIYCDCLSNWVHKGGVSREMLALPLMWKLQGAIYILPFGMKHEGEFSLLHPPPLCQYRQLNQNVKQWRSLWIRWLISIAHYNLVAIITAQGKMELFG